MNLSKLHIKYILSKRSKILILLLYILLGMSYLLTAINYNELPNSIAIEQYFEENFFISQILVNVVVIFICTNSLIPINDNYGMMLVPYFRGRHYYVITKITTMLLLVFAFNLLNSQLMLIIGKVFIKNFYVPKNIRYRIFEFYIITFYYGSLSILFAVMFKSLYSSILIIGLLIASLSFNDDKIINYLKYFFPILNSKGLIINGRFYFIIVIIIILLIANVIYDQNDFKK